MSASLATRVGRASAATLAGALLVAGLGTSAALVWSERHGLDRGLLAAAHERAHPDTAERYQVEHAHHVPRAWEVDSADPLVPPADAARALRSERPVYADVGDMRVVLLPVEREHRGHEDDEEHLLIAAAAPQIPVWHAVDQFVVPYALFAALAALAAAGLQRRLVRAALAPVDVARRDAEAVVGLGQGRRLATGGPPEIAGLLASFNALLDRLDDASHAQGRFTAEAAHELRTPVTAMLGELDVTLRRPRDAAAYEAVLRSTREEAARMGQLIAGLVALARLDAGEVDRHRDPIRAGELAERAAHHEEAALRDAGCALTLQIDDDPELDVHVALAEAALGNLLRNAARHAPGAPVRLTVSRRDDAAVFTVDDGGPGLSAADRDAVFDRFARTGEARRRDRAGLGLGLPLAREVARRHGGDCALSPSPAGGLRAALSFRLPAA